MNFDYYTVDAETTLFYSLNTGNIKSYCGGRQTLDYFGVDKADYELIYGYIYINHNEDILKHLDLYIVDLETKNLVKKEDITIPPTNDSFDMRSELNDVKDKQQVQGKALGKVGETTVWNTSDINDVVMPYCLDLDFQVSNINGILEAIAPKGVEYKLKTNFGGNDMTYTVLKRQIIGQQLTLERALEMIEVFEYDRKLNKEQVEELTVLAHSYLK
ncbi:MAG: hypothetical protein ACRCX2_36125 [Paraclostridium sp.]